MEELTANIIFLIITIKPYLKQNLHSLEQSVVHIGHRLWGELRKKQGQILTNFCKKPYIFLNCLEFTQIVL